MRAYATLWAMSMSTAPEYVIPKWTLADRFRKARSLAGMDQRGFSAALSVAPATYAHWELGTNTPRNLVAVAKRVEVLTKIPAAWLLDVPPGRDVNFGWSTHRRVGHTAVTTIGRSRYAA